MYKKLKSFYEDDAFFYTLLIIIVGIVSFGLGRQSVSEINRPTTNTNPAGVVFTQSSDIVPPQAESLSVLVVASRSGTKYHLPTCPGASQIKAENKITFESIELASAAGYTPAANCPGLK